jgi:hypothetical protein
MKAINDTENIYDYKINKAVFHYRYSEEKKVKDSLA